MHECLSVQDWIRAWGDPEGETGRLSACPRCWPLRQDVAAWAEAVAACEDCRAALETSLLSEEVLNCPACMKAFSKLHEMVDGLEHFDPSVAPEIRTAEELAAKLNRMPLAAKVARVTDDLRYQQWGLVQHLLAASRELWCSDPELAHERAVVAVAIADLLDPMAYQPLWVADLQAKAHAYLANTHRILAQFQDAEREFMAAETCIRGGTGSGQARATVLSLKASLHIDQQRFEEAALLLESVLAFHEATGDAEATARAFLKLAIVEKGRGELAAAADLCFRALSYLEPGQHRRLWVLAHQNAADYTLAAGDVLRARAMFDSLPPAVDRSMERRRLWTEGRLLRAEGEAGAARVAYGAARKGFTDDGRHYYAALVSLEEAALALEEGEPFDALELAQKASVLLVQGAARQEALAVLRVLLTAMERGMADRALVLTLAQRIDALKPSS